MSSKPVKRTRSKEAFGKAIRWLEICVPRSRSSASLRVFTPGSQEIVEILTRDANDCSSNDDGHEAVLQCLGDDPR